LLINANCIQTNILIKVLTHKKMAKDTKQQPQNPGNEPKAKANSMPRYQTPPPPPTNKKG
jgi:hypothetical protein